MEAASSAAGPSSPTGATRVNRQELPRATARLVTAPTWQKSVAGAGCAGASASPAGARRLRAERPDHPEGGEVDPDRLKPGASQRLEQGEDHLAPRGDDDDVDLRRRALRGRDPADHPVVDDGLLERHRYLLLGLEAHRGVELGGVVDRRQPQGAHDDPLVGDSEADPAAQPVLREDRAQLRRQHLRVGHLAVVEDLGRQRSDRGGGEPRAAVGADLGCGDAAGLDLEPDQRIVLFPRQLDHPRLTRRLGRYWIGRFAPDLGPSTRIRKSSGSSPASPCRPPRPTEPGR